MDASGLLHRRTSGVDGHITNSGPQLVGLNSRDENMKNMRLSFRTDFYSFLGETRAVRESYPGLPSGHSLFHYLALFLSSFNGEEEVLIL